MKVSPSPRPQSHKLRIVSLVILGVAASLLLHRIMFPPLSPEQSLGVQVDALGKKLPLKLNDERTLLAVEQAPGLRMVRHEQFINTPAVEITPKVVEDLRAILRDEYLNSADLRDLRNWGVTFVYRFTDKNGTPVAEIVIGPGGL